VSAAAGRLRYAYKRSFRPDVAECERRIVDTWFAYCDEVRTPSTGLIRYDAIRANQLHDFGVLRTRAMKRAPGGAA
jgi:hypothetical protein